MAEAHTPGRWRDRACPARGAHNALNASHSHCAVQCRADAARRRAARCAGLARASQSIREMKQVPTYIAHAPRATRAPSDGAHVRPLPPLPPLLPMRAVLCSAALLTALPHIDLRRPCGKCRASSAHRTRSGDGRSAALARTTSRTLTTAGRSAAQAQSTSRTLSARLLAFDRARHPTLAAARRCIYVDRACHPPRAAAPRRCLFLTLPLALPRPRSAANVRAPRQGLRTQRTRARTGCCQAFRKAIRSTRGSSSKGAGSRFTSTRQNGRPAYGQ